MTPLLPLEDAVAKIDARTPIGSLLRSADWERVPTALRERAQFSAGVTSARVLQTIQDRLSDQLSLQRERLANGQSATFDRSSFIDAVRELAREEGLTPADPKERGTLRDITSIPRLGLIYDMQNQMATGYARWKMDQSEGALLLYPAWEFTRVEDRRVPREEKDPGFWDRRWVAAAQAAGDDQAVRVFRDTGRKVALKTSGIWSKLSRFGTPWMPFDWGSGMGTEDVDRDDAIALGLIAADELPAPTGEQDFNQELEASARDLAPEFRSVLSEHFGDQIDIAGDTIRWNTTSAAADYERQLESQRQISGSQFPRSAEAFSPLRSTHWGAPGTQGILRDATQEWGVQIAAVASGRKPLFHEAIGESAPLVAERLRQTLPAGVHVAARDGQLIVWHDKAAAPFLKPGASTSDQLFAHANDGTMLGYGVNIHGRPTPQSVQVQIVEVSSGKVVSGFRAPRKNAALWGRARARDWADAVGGHYEARILA